MHLFYSASCKLKLPVAVLLLFCSFLVLPARLIGQVKDSTVTAIYTDFKSYWKSSISSINTLYPDTSHNLLAFTFRGKTYSTGVNDTVLNTKLGTANYSAQVYKALPVNNIGGSVVSGGSTYIATALKNDGDSTKAAYTAPYPVIRIADVLTDGKSGLDLGTGVTNLPKGAHISFAIKSLSAKSSIDSVPDLVFTQIADPTSNGSDTIFFYDANGNIVGNEKLVNWSGVSKAGTYKLDLYTLTNTTCNTSAINGMFQQNTTRDIRMVAFLLTEFGITNATLAAQVKGVQINPNGTSDQAFIAYNTAIINLDVPVITTQPKTQTLCSSNNTSATFSISATSTTALSYQWKKNGAAIAGATAASYTAIGLTLADTANVYTVTLTNSVGAVTSDPAYVKYVIVAQPADVYTPSGTPATFTVGTSGATGYQWKYQSFFSNVTISGATGYSYTIPSVSASTPTSYFTVVSYPGGTCNSNIATLNLESLPSITAQPQSQTFCSNATTAATFTVAVTGPSAISYQWYKNGSAIAGATANSYTATGLTLADTSGLYKVVITSRAGSVTSNSVGIKYIILAQPSSQYVATGTPVTFSVTTSGATAYLWQKGGATITGAITAAYTIASAALSNSGSYTVIVTHSGGTCTSSAATLTVENLPAITTQPISGALCSTAATSVTFSIAATSTSALSYQWKKNGVAISGATSGSYTATGLTPDDTANVYRVTITNGVGSVTSNGVGFKYIIIAQPSPASAYLATGNAVTFTTTVSSAVTSFLWKKNGIALSNAVSSSYSIGTVNTSDAGSYTLDVSYAGGSCTSNTAVLTTSTVLYSKLNGNISKVATWGVVPDGSGSTPVDFTRAEHTFVVANRDTASTTSNLTIAGTLDVANAKTSITPGTVLEAGRIIRSLTIGTLAGSATSALTVHGASRLYFDPVANTLQTLLINTTDTVRLHTRLNITAGNAHGMVTVSSGVFATGDSLTLKSDAYGTAAIGSSSGTISGKVTVERFIPARRAWRLFCAPVAKTNAPTINAAWQEGASSSTDNPNPGFGTHITYGSELNGFDQNPQKTYSMYVYNNGSWSGIPPTKTTLVTDYNAYLFFIRGDRSYNITTTTNITTPGSTIIRTTGNINQGTQPAIPVSVSGFTLIGNPYASPLNFEKLYQHSTNLAHRLRVWNPALGGTKGVGAYVLLYWDGSSYSAIPNVGNASVLKNIQANQAFFVESTGTAGSISIMEADKDTANTTVPFGRKMATENLYASKLEVNLKVFNDDSTTGIADGIAYLFNDTFSNKVDNDDIVKIANTNENLSIANNSSLLTLEQRTIPLDDDSLHLHFTGAKTTGYQLEIASGQMNGKRMFLYDKYLNTLSLISQTDTSRYNFNVATSIAASKAPDRFSIIVKDAAVLPVTFTKLNAYKKSNTIQIDWGIKNELNTQYYEVEKSCTGKDFNSIGQVVATNSTYYSFTDEAPCSGYNFYRVKGVSANREASYTSIVKVIVGEDKPAITVYPNPVTSNHFFLEMKNQPAGKYQLTLTSNTGQVVYTNTFLYNGESTMQPVSLRHSLAGGIYQLLVEANGERHVLKLLFTTK